MVEGQNQFSREAVAEEFTGADVKLLSTDPSDDVTNSTLSNVEATETTSDSDWSITSDNTAGTTTLQTTSDIAFGSTPSFTLDAIVLQSTGTVDDMIIDDSPTGDTDLTGDGDLTISAGNISYTFGGE